MPEFKGTPGPWFITGNMTRYVEARIEGGFIQEVASCGPTAADSGYGQQQEANAQLIAAAPDLLEALTKAEAELHAIKESIGFRRETLSVIEQARAALAKALGQ